MEKLETVIKRNRNKVIDFISSNPNNVGGEISIEVNSVDYLKEIDSSIRLNYLQMLLVDKEIKSNLKTIVDEILSYCNDKVLTSSEAEVFGIVSSTLNYLSEDGILECSECNESHSLSCTHCGGTSLVLSDSRQIEKHTQNYLSLSKDSVDSLVQKIINS